MRVRLETMAPEKSKWLLQGKRKYQSAGSNWRDLFDGWMVGAVHR